jgi:hypothetical protein
MKILILFSINILFFLKVSSQSVDWMWASSPSSSNVNIIEGCISVDNSSNLYVCGGFRHGSVTFGSYTLTCSATDEMFLAKYAPNGNVLWAKDFVGTTNANSGALVCTDVFENVYAVGGFSDTLFFGSDTLISHYGVDIIAVKYDSSGNVIWTRDLGGPGQGTNINSIATAPLGSVYITGYTQDTIFTIGSFTFTNPIGNYVFIAKFDSSGTVLWAKVTGGATANGGNAVATDGLENVYLSGYFTVPYLVFGNDTVHQTGTHAYFLVKFDSGGNTLWAKNTGSTFGGGDNYLVTDADNNVYETYQDMYSDFSFFSKFNSSGNLIWSKADTSNYLYPNGLATDKHGKIYFAGDFVSDTIKLDTVTLIKPHSSIGCYIIEFDSSGTAIWGKTILSGSNYPLSVAVASSECIYAAGGFIASPFILGNDTLIPSSANENVFVGKLCFSGFGENISETKKNNGVVVYPNPFDTKLTVATKVDGEFELTLFDVTSRKIFNRSFINSATINTEQLARGMYFYEVRCKNDVEERGKLVKE